MRIDPLPRLWDAMSDAASESADGPVRVLLADDQEKVRSALRLLIEQEADFHIVGEAGSADELLRALHAVAPHVVLLDWELPGLPGEGKLRAMRALDPQLKIIAMSGTPEARKSALGEGVDGFVSKSEPPDRLLQVLYFVQHRVWRPSQRS